MKAVKLKNTIQEYKWGSKIFIPNLLGKELSSIPQAELWMGVHSKAPSRFIQNGKELTLSDVINQNPQILGKNIVDKFDGKFPFLLKVLAAAEPLSIQVHPNKKQAAEGFNREKKAGIPSDALNRNYKDDNHKPELICALTQFDAMCGFQPLAEICDRFQYLGIVNLIPTAKELINNPSPQNFKIMFTKMMMMNKQDQATLVNNVISKVREKRFRDSNEKLIFEWLDKLADFYPDDIGVLAPLYLNVIRLQPNEALSLDAGILHAYLEGSGIEIMANSDNVLRGGLTPKNIDVPELLKTLVFHNEKVRILHLQKINKFESEYHTPALEFELSIIKVEGEYAVENNFGAEIILCTEGYARIADVYIKKGESAFVPNMKKYLVSGNGIFYRAKVPVKK